MESIEAKAFKSSCFSPEIATKPANSQALGAGEDYLLISPAGVGDDFSVDEFFDLQGLSEEEGEEEEEKSSSESSSSSLSSQDQIDEGSSVSGAGFSSFLSAADGLAIPVDDMKELELWSHLMDGTLFDEVAAWPTRNTYIKTGPNVDRRVRPEPETKPATVDATRFPPPTPVKPTGPNVDKRVRPEPETKPATVDATHFPPPTLVKPRSKRQKISTGAWLASWLLQTGDSSFSSEPGFESPTAAVQVTTTSPTKSKKPGVRKPRRKPAAAVDDGSLAAPVQQRKCTHCQVQKTPQWRTGPFGPKTLCNACGVRFKSGRLFPEYRPACSPTFTSEIHSNSHRKVIEMRKKKMAEPGAADFLPTVLSC